MRDIPDETTITFHATLEGLDPMPWKARSLDAASARLPGGAYTTLRTYEQRKILRLDDHLARLVQSARQLDPQETNLPSHTNLVRDTVARVLGWALDRTGFSNSRIRLTLAVPGGELYVSVQPFEGIVSELLERGVAVATCPIIEHDTQAKATRSIQSLHGAQALLPGWAHEGVMVDPAGCLLEGLSSNFLAIKGSPPALYTAGSGVIAGNVRAVVLRLATGMMPVLLEPICLPDLPVVTECMLTSASREVLPVVRVDERVIGDGWPGPIARELLARFRRYVHEHAEAV